MEEADLSEVFGIDLAGGNENDLDDPTVKPKASARKKTVGRAKTGASKTPAGPRDPQGQNRRERPEKNGRLESIR